MFIKKHLDFKYINIHLINHKLYYYTAILV